MLLPFTSSSASASALSRPTPFPRVPLRKSHTDDDPLDKLPGCDEPLVKLPGCEPPPVKFPERQNASEAPFELLFSFPAPAAAAAETDEMRLSAARVAGVNLLDDARSIPDGTLELR